MVARWHKTKHTVPSTGLAARVPQVMQMEAVECGAACLTMICAYYGKWLSLGQVRADCGISRDGSSAKLLLRAARSYGFTAKGFRFDAETLQNKGEFPCIVHWEFNHFIVLRGFKRGFAYINDPARGELRMPVEQFNRGFTGVVLQLAPLPTFEPGGKPASVRSFVQTFIGSSTSSLVVAAISCALVSAGAALNPALSQLFIDKLLMYGNPPMWVLPFVVALAGASLFQIVALVLNARNLLLVQGKLAVGAQSGMIWQLLHLPMEFFAQRSAGDLAARASSTTRVASILANRLAPLLVDAVMLVFYLVVMLSYAPKLALIGLVATAINLWIARAISGKRVNIARVQMRDQANLDASTVAGIGMVETIRAAGAEEAYFQRWGGYQAGALNMRAQAARLDATLGVLPQLVSALANTAVLICGVLMIQKLQFLPGMLMAFQGFMAQFARPAESLVITMQALLEMRSDMERISDVMDYKRDALANASSAELADVSLSEPADTSSLENTHANTLLSKLVGEVELQNVTFGYARLSAPLISNFNLHVEPGKSVAIVGPSGCGKSTIARLISGLYMPWKGEVLLDGKPLQNIPHAVRTASVAVVDQDIVLFEDSVSNNIRFWDATLSDAEVIAAARDAQLHDEIAQRPGGYEAKLAPSGANLSGGQRQRLEIARALALNPSILVLDEATSALDAITEEQVMRAIRARGISLVVVAHRLSTIRDCDEIIAMDAGHIVERGSHEELMAHAGLYAQLVSGE